MNVYLLIHELLEFESSPIVHSIHATFESAHAAMEKEFGVTLKDTTLNNSTPAATQSAEYERTLLPSGGGVEYLIAWIEEWPVIGMGT